MAKILITGGAGFIGHHLVDYLLRTTDHQLTLIDRLDTSGNLNRLADIGAAKNPRVRFIFHDLKAAISDQLAAQIGEHDYIVHMAAATHVDRSITHPMEFVLDNVVATANMLDFARLVGCKQFVQFSTDEVFGPAPIGTAYREDDRYRSGNPYAATKAGAEELAIAYENTYKVPVIVTHTMNVFGERQHPEKFIPNTIRKIHNGEKVIIHASRDLMRPGSRFYLHARTVAEAVVFLFEHGRSGQKYNLVGEREIDNLQLANMLAEAQDKPLHYEMVDFHSSRPGHDLRYALNGSKMYELGFSPMSSTPILLSRVSNWFLTHKEWLK